MVAKAKPASSAARTLRRGRSGGPRRRACSRAPRPSATGGAVLRNLRLVDGPGEGRDGAEADEHAAGDVPPDERKAPAAAEGRLAERARDDRPRAVAQEAE